MPRADLPRPASADWSSVKAWRTSLRKTLLAERAELSIDERRKRWRLVRARLEAEIDLRAFAALGFYWPIRAEIDLRDAAARHVDAGGVAALPVVTTRNAPVEFWRWRPGASMRRGFWNIPVPAERDVVHPDVLVIPLVGFDAHCYRLGYGGGYYDRTLAAAEPRPWCIGVGYAEAELATIYPQPHDVSLDAIVTDTSVYRRARSRTSDR